MRANQRMIEQAGAIPVRSGRVCLVTSRHTGRWIVPKGRIEKGKTRERIALDEAWEEAGLKGELVGGPVGTYRYQKLGRSYRVTVFLMHVQDAQAEWPEKGQRKRRWLPVAQAIEHVCKTDLRELIRRAALTTSASRSGRKNKKTTAG